MKREFDSLYEDFDQRVRRSALNELIPWIGGLPDARLIAFCRFLKDYNNVIVRAALVKIIMDTSQAVWGEIEPVIRSLPDSTRDEVIEGFYKSEDEGRHKLALKFTVEFSSEKHLSYIFGLWESASASLRVEVIKALRVFTGRKIEEFFLSELKKENDAEVLQEILRSFSVEEVKRYFRTLIKFIKHDSARVRYTVTRILGQELPWWYKKKYMDLLDEERDPFVLNAILTNLLPRSNDYFANKLLGFVLDEAIDAVAKEKFVHYFRLLPEDILFKLCKKTLSYKRSEESLQFIITEMTYIDDEEVANILIKLIKDTETSELIRSICIEGLGLHASQEVKDFLALYCRTNPDEFFMTNMAVVSLTKIWQNSDIKQIVSLIDLEDERYMMETQAILTFIDKKLRSKKLEKSEELMTMLLKCALHENINCSYLAMNSLLHCQNVPIVKLIELFKEDLDPENLKTLIQLVVINIEGELQYVFDWLNNYHDNKLVCDRAIELFECLADHKEYAVEFFIDVIEWNDLDKGKHLAGVVEVINKCLKRIETRKKIKKRLNEMPLLDMEKLLYLSSVIYQQYREDVLHDVLLNAIDLDNDEYTLRRVILLIRDFESTESVRKLVELYLAKPILREMVATSFQKVESA